MSEDDPKPIGAIAGDFAAEWRRRWGMEAPLPSDTPPTPPDISALVRAQRLARFKEFCPPEFRKPIDRAQIPNLAAWDRADTWDGKFPGLWLWSQATGMAKTRMLWRKFGQLHVEHGRTVQRTTGLNLSEEYHDAFNRNTTRRFHDDLTSCQVVMLDDLDKMLLPQRGLGYSDAAHADRNGRMLREIFDTFYEQHTSVLVTSNEPIEWFSKRIGRSGDRRMHAVCAEVAF